MTQEIGIREVFQQVDARLSAVESAVENLRREQATNFRWVIGILLGTLFPMWATVILTIILRT